LLDQSEDTLLGLTTDVVSAFAGHNSIAAADLPALIRSVHASLAAAVSSAAQPPEPEALVPAVSIRKSVTPDYLICLEDGKRFKSLKRHLGAKYGLTPDAYREKWGLPHDYPMVAPNYAASRSALAKATGLGRKPGEATTTPEPAVTSLSGARERRRAAA